MIRRLIKNEIKNQKVLSISTVIFTVGIAFLLIFLLLSIGVERDRNEAGLLKALGIHRKQIRQIYMAKYLLFSVIGGGITEFK